MSTPCFVGVGVVAMVRRWGTKGFRFRVFLEGRARTSGDDDDDDTP